MIELWSYLIRDMERQKETIEAKSKQNATEIEELNKRLEKLRREYEHAYNYDDMNPADKLLFLKYMWQNTKWSDNEELHERADNALKELAKGNYPETTRRIGVKAYEELEGNFWYA